MNIKNNQSKIKILDEVGKREHIAIIEQSYNNQIENHIIRMPNFHENFEKSSNFSEDSYFVDDLSNLRITHSLRQYDRMLEMR